MDQKKEVCNYPKMQRELIFVQGHGNIIRNHIVEEEIIQSIDSENQCDDGLI